MLTQSAGCELLTCRFTCHFQARWKLLKKQQEHRECCSEVQHLCAQLERAQGRLHSQELELERLRPLEVWLGQYQREQQVSRMVGTSSGSSHAKRLDCSPGQVLIQEDMQQVQRAEL